MLFESEEKEKEKEKIKQYQHGLLDGLIDGT